MKKPTEKIEEINDETDSETSTPVNSGKLTLQKKLLYQTALTLVLKLKSGDEYFLHDTLATFIFNMNVWSAYINPGVNNVETTSTNLLVKYFEQLKLNNKQETAELSYLNLNAGQPELIKINTKAIKNLEALIYENLNQIKLVYIGTLLDNKLLEHSRRLNSRTVSTSSQLTTLFLSVEYSNKFLLKADWIYAPIQFYVSLINMSATLAKTTDIDVTRIISTVSNSLKFVYLLEVYFTEYLDRSLEITLRYLNLLYVYLFESEVFLDKQIVTYLYLILLKYTKDTRAPLESLNLNMQMPGLISFYDFYKHILAHYDSTSFGDYMFSQFIIIPLQQKCSVKYRQLFWSEYFHLFRYIRCDTPACEAMLPARNFLEPCEKSLNMIRQYSQILLDQADSQLAGQSKLAYTILIAHVNAYIFEHTNETENKLEFDFKKLLVEKFLSLGNEVRQNMFSLFCVFFF